MALEIGYYDGNSREWDDFMLRSSRNGTFLQTRQFIDYHQNQRFTDRSLCIRSGQELAAAVFGCEWQDEEGRRVFYGHRGTTYGGITVSDQIYTATRTNELFETMEVFLRTEGFDRVYLRMVPTLFTGRLSAPGMWPYSYSRGSRTSMISAFAVLRASASLLLMSTGLPKSQNPIFALPF